MIQRPTLALLHRWFGLFIALFLFVSGLTGAVISWDHELDEWLNPHLFHSNTPGTPQQPLELANQVEANDARLHATFVPLATEPGHALGLGIDSRIDPATGKAFVLGFNQMALDPVTGETLGKREWGEISLSRENLLPFLYKLHYTMYIPDGWGIELGVLFMGIVGIVWVFDSFVALWISFPNLNVWRKSFAFRWKKGGYALNFDLHRSGGVWIWAFLLLLAVTSVSMNLNFQVVRPIVSLFSTLTPSAFESRTPNPEDMPIAPKVTREYVIAQAKTEALRLNWQAPAGAVFYSPEFGIYGVGFFEPGKDHGDGGLGNPWLYYDGQDGKALGSEVPGTGSAGDIFMQAQFPLHSGRIIGLPGRIMISFMGLVVAMLSLTGLLIWFKKRKSRIRVKLLAKGDLAVNSA